MDKMVNSEQEQRSDEERIAEAISRASSSETISDKEMKRLLASGVNADELVLSIGNALSLAFNLDSLIANGANINLIVTKMMGMNQAVVIDHIENLMAHGAKININKLIAGSSYRDGIAYKIEYLVARGANVITLVTAMNGKKTASRLKRLLDGTTTANADDIIQEMDSVLLGAFFNLLVAHGATPGKIVSKMKSPDVAKHIDTITAHGVNLDFEKIISEMNNWEIYTYVEKLLSHGASPNGKILCTLKRPYRNDKEFLGILLKYSADINKIIEHMTPKEIIRSYDYLVAHGAKINFDWLVSKMTPEAIGAYAEFLMAHGVEVDLNHVIKYLRSATIARNLEFYLNKGADINLIMTRMKPVDIKKKRETLLAHGVNFRED